MINDEKIKPFYQKIAQIQVLIKSNLASKSHNQKIKIPWLILFSFGRGVQISKRVQGNSPMSIIKVCFREEYYSCSVRSKTPRVVAYCDSPHRRKWVDILNILIV